MQAVPPTPHANRLIRQTSPYLLQHAHNPVDWYSWGEEAFAAARAANKPIFLSVGYSTCYWCHVMERECFEVESVAAEMNARFVNIKVDREERPDVDQLYMTAVQVLARQGGWPMSVFLTTDRQPFYGGTYFPPTDQQGRPGFLTLLRGLDDAYHHRKAEVKQTADQLVAILHRLAEPERPRTPITVDEAFVHDLIQRSIADYEPAFGGFGSAPKFPRETLLELLLTYLSTPGEPGHSSFPSGDPNAPIRKMLLHTLDAMAFGGIRDQLGGGFHRYSTDMKWLVPHFEIMLYDNAMLAWCYAEAHRQTKEPRYAQVAREAFDFVLREMTSPQGAFFTALDAEVDAREGLSYLWTRLEIEQVLGEKDAAVFNAAYGVDRGPNFIDPHHGSGVADQNILYLAQPMLAGRDILVDPELARMRQQLYAARQQRKQPLLDTKIITSWNALMVRALAHGGAVFKDDRYIEAAARAARFLLEQHRMPDGGLLRTSGGGRTRDGGPTTAPDAHPPAIRAFLDDYAYLAQALLALDSAQPSEGWRDRAIETSDVMIQRFGDARTMGGFYFTDADARDLIVRQKVASDSPLPSGNAVAASVLLDLGRTDRARGVLAVFAGQLEQQGEGMSALVQAALLYVRRLGPTTITPGTASSSAQVDRPISPQEAAREVVTAQAQWADPQRLLIHLKIRDGFHVNAHAIDAGTPLIPTVVSIPDPLANVETIDYPPGEELMPVFVDVPLHVYTGQATIVVRFRSPWSAGSTKIALSYQACDASACLPPAVKSITVDAPGK